MKAFGALGAFGGLGATAAFLAATVRIVPGDPPPARAPDAPRSVPALVVPVEGVRARDLRDTWHDARDGGARMHEGIDIIAPRGRPVLAAMAGRIEKLFESKAGGRTIYIRSQALMAYYAHLDGYAPGLAEGQAVRAGQEIGFVGDSGNAGPGNTHLHFALARMAAGERWWQGTPFDPFPLLARAATPR